MKRITLFFFIFCSLNAIGQEKLKIKIDNPEPRVGQSVTFSINDEFLTNYFEKELGENIEFTTSTSIFGIQTNDFERVIIFKKAKKYKIGPFNFEFNGKKYTTDVIEVNILPELPMEEGLWLRLIEFEGKKYLILEQLISNESDKSNKGNDGYSYTIGGVKPEGKEFSKLEEQLTDGIELSNYSSRTTTINPDGTGLFDIGFSYSYNKYKINIDDDFEGEYIITEKDIQNLPKVFDLGKIILKK